MMNLIYKSYPCNKYSVNYHTVCRYKFLKNFINFKNLALLRKGQEVIFKIITAVNPEYIPYQRKCL